MKVEMKKFMIIANFPSFHKLVLKFTALEPIPRDIKFVQSFWFLQSVCVYQILTISPSSPPKSSHKRRAPSSADIFNLSKDLLQSGVGGDPGLTPFPVVPRVPAE